MELDSLLSITSGWLDGTGPESDVVISSRIRLARNLAQFPFLSRADDFERTEIEHVVRDTVLKHLGASNPEKTDAVSEDQSEQPEQDKSAPDKTETTTKRYDDLQYVDVKELSEIDRQFLMERQLISRELSEAKGARGVLIADRQQTSLMVNEEDHIRLQVLRNGFNLDSCWAEINRLDDVIENDVSYAFHEQFGYLTACPTNVGTGIRVSVMLHLPALVQTREIKKVFQSMQKMNLAVRGLYGEGSQAMGDYYQISNQITLGKSEAEVIDMIKDVIPNVIAYERRVRAKLMEENQQGLHDQASRAYGILRSAQTISSEETLHLLSSLRMGANLGLIVTPQVALANEILIYTQPAHLQKKHDKELNSQERNVVRASYLRERLADTEAD
ncbi:MAG: protein arginine kinase [Planctomycetaceae bacterium]|nr:protein arginine kinase [Planctomycetaceae bacterium]